MPNKDPTPSLSPEETPMERWWTVQQVAHYLQVKPSTVYRLVNSGEIPFLRLGRLLRFKKSLLDNWIKNQIMEKEKENEEKRRMVLEIFNSNKRSSLDIEQIIKKNIEEIKRNRYTSSSEKPGKEKGLGKEGKYGII